MNTLYYLSDKIIQEQKVQMQHMENIMLQQAQLLELYKLKQEELVNMLMQKAQEHALSNKMVADWLISNNVCNVHILENGQYKLIPKKCYSTQDVSKMNTSSN